MDKTEDIEMLNGNLIFWRLAFDLALTAADKRRAVHNLRVTRKRLAQLARGEAR